MPGTRRWVAAVTTTVSGSAAPCTRAATFAVSPNTSPPSAMTTGPVCMPIRTASRVPSPALSRAFDWPHRVEDREPRANGALGVVLARIGPAEVDEQAVAQLLGDVAAPALDRDACGLLVLPDDVAPLLGVELLGERRRADEVAEEDGELAALARR